MTDDIRDKVEALMSIHNPQVLGKLIDLMTENGSSVGLSVTINLVTTALAFCLATVKWHGGDEDEIMKIIMHAAVVKADDLIENFPSFSVGGKEQMN